MHKSEFILGNETHKITWDFKIQTAHLNPTLKPDLVLINKKQRICHLSDFAIPADHRERKQKD